MKNIFENLSVKSAETLIELGYIVTKDDVIFAAAHNYEMFDFLITKNSFKEHGNDIVKAAVISKDIDTILTALVEYDTLAECGYVIIGVLKNRIKSGAMFNKNCFELLKLLHYKYNLDVSEVINIEISNNENQNYKVLSVEDATAFYDTADKLVTGLMVSLEAKNIEFVKILVEVGADLNMVSKLIAKKDSDDDLL